MSATFKTESAASAVLSVCEGLILALGRNGVLDRREILAALGDARDAHAALARESGDVAVHARSAELIQSLMVRVESRLDGAR